MNKIILLGANGQLGAELKEVLSRIGLVYAFSKEELDISDQERVRKLCRELRPAFIVNAAAYTAVDLAESQIESAFSVNASAVRCLASVALELDCWLIHFSTDYVFDGLLVGHKYHEEDFTSPASIYGQSKLEGERAISETECRHIILRTSWVYSIRGRNFPKTILKLAKENETLEVVSDQIGAPTSVKWISKATNRVLEELIGRKDGGKRLSGLYHCSSQGSTSWHGFAVFLIERAILLGYPLLTKPELIRAVSTAEINQIAIRPKNSLLNNEKFARSFSIEVPSWRQQAETFLNDFKEEGLSQ